MTDAKFSVPPT